MSHFAASVAWAQEGRNAVSPSQSCFSWFSSVKALDLTDVGYAICLCPLTPLAFHPQNAQREST